MRHNLIRCMKVLLVKINMIEVLVKKNNLDLRAKFNSVVMQQAHYVCILIEVL